MVSTYSILLLLHKESQKNWEVLDFSLSLFFFKKKKTSRHTNLIFLLL